MKIYLQAAVDPLFASSKNSKLQLLAKKANKKAYTLHNNTLKEMRHLTAINGCDRSDILKKGPRTLLCSTHTQLHTVTTKGARDGFFHPSNLLTGH